MSIMATTASDLRREQDSACLLRAAGANANTYSELAPSLLPGLVKMVAAPAALSAAAASHAPVAVCVEDIVGYCLPYLSIRDASALKTVSRSLGTVASQHSVENLAIVKSALYAAGPSVKVFETYGASLLSLSVRSAALLLRQLCASCALVPPRDLSHLQLHRVPFADRGAFPLILSLCPNLRKLSLHDCDWHWDDALAAAGVASLGKLQELRLQCADAVGAERNPFSAIVCRLHELPQLRKLTLFSRLDAAAMTRLVAFLAEPLASRRLMKLKVSTGLLASPGGQDVLLALATHARLEKVTIVRPDGLGEPLRKPQCALLARAMVSSPGLRALHLRRCGMWTDTLQALVPAAPCPNMRRLKLDGNSLGYLSGAYFSEAMDALLSRCPRLEALHLGNNQLDAKQAEALAASLVRHRIQGLENLTLGSNDIGDAGLTAIAKALPAGLKQLYLHGIDCTDAGIAALRDGLDRWPTLWGLGLNGNPITDSGARTLARALRGRASLRDVGITLSEMTDAGVARLATALATCPRLRYCYLYSQGYKAANKVTDEAKAKLKKELPPYATAAFDHRLSRYLKKAD